MTQRREFKLAAVLTLTDRLTGPLKRISAGINRHFAAPIAHAKVLTNQLSSAVNTLGTGALIGAAAGVAVLAKATTDYAQRADDMVKAARSAGMEVERFSELAHAADLSAVPMDALAKASAKLNKNLADARQKSGAMYGVMKKNAPTLLASLLAAKDNAEAFRVLAGAYKATNDPAKRTQMLMSAFGRSAMDLASLMDLGADGIADMAKEAQRLGIVITADAAQAAEQFNDDLARMKMGLAGVAASIGSQLLPILTPLIQQMTGWIAKNRELIGQKVQAFVSGVAEAIQKIDFGAVISGVKLFAKGASDLIDKLGGLQTIAQAVAIMVGVKLVTSVVSLFMPLITLTYHVAALATTLTIQLVKAITKVIAAMIAWVATAITPAVTALVTMLAPALTMVGAAFSALAAGIVLSMKLIAGVTGIGLLIALAGWAVADWEGFKSTFAGIWEWIKGAARSFVQPLVDAFQWLWSIIEPIIEGIKSGFDAAVSGLRAVGLMDEAPTNGDPTRAVQIGQSILGGGSSKIEVVARFENAPPGLRVDRPTTDGAPTTARVQVQSNTGKRTLATGGAL